MKWNKKFMFF